MRDAGLQPSELLQLHSEVTYPEGEREKRAHTAQRPAKKSEACTSESSGAGTAPVSRRVNNHTSRQRQIFSGIVSDITERNEGAAGAGREQRLGLRRAQLMAKIAHSSQGWTVVRALVRHPAAADRGDGASPGTSFGQARGRRILCGGLEAVHDLTPRDVRRGLRGICAGSTPTAAAGVGPALERPVHPCDDDARSSHELSAAQPGASLSTSACCAILALRDVRTIH